MSAVGLHVQQRPHGNTFARIPMIIATMLLGLLGLYEGAKSFLPWSAL